MVIFERTKNFFLRMWRYAQGHKIKSSILLIILLAAGYYGYKFLNKTEEQTRYILASATKGMITTTVSGTGQVAPKEEKTIKAKASGEITYLNPNATAGATISKGTLIASIDTTEAKKTIQSAEENLESAKITLEKLEGAEGSEIPRNKQEAIDDLSKAYEDGYNSVSTIFLDLPNIMVGLNTILYGRTFNNYQQNIDYYTYSAYSYNEKALLYRDSANKSYQTAKTAYDKSFEDYKATSRYSDEAAINAIIVETYKATKDMAQAVKDANNLIQFYKDTLSAKSMETNSTADTHLTSLSSYLSKTNSALSTLFSSQTTIKNDIEAITDADLDLRTQKLTVEQKERSLKEAQDALSDYYIYATINGVISEINIAKGDDVSSGSTAATIITESKIAGITLSEVDVANIKTGNKATLTFDAIEDLTITGEVTEVDSVGTASSGVVSYGVEIAFDTNEENVKSGMSVSATIITNAKNDVLTIPTTAVKSQGDTYYVQALSKAYDLTDKTNSIKGVVSSTAPTAKTVEIGLSDDTNTEITSGLSEGDQVVVRLSTSTTTSSSTSSGSSKSNSILNTSGGGMPAGGPPGM
jgi:HlyD family secretion protein